MDGCTSGDLYHRLHSQAKKMNRTEIDSCIYVAMKHTLCQLNHASERDMSKRAHKFPLRSSYPCLSIHEARQNAQVQERNGSDPTISTHYALILSLSSLHCVCFVCGSLQSSEVCPGVKVPQLDRARLFREYVFKDS